jgi:Fe-coproporphyrin III synthase
VDLARRLGALQISFLAVDVANPHAFARHEGFESDLALRPVDLPELERLIGALERDQGAAFASGFIAESPAKLRRIHQYFSAVCGLEAYPPVRCNAPQFSAVVDAQGHVSPCFFIPGPSDARVRDGLDEVLNHADMAALRASIRVGGRRECKTCVCSMWRDCA